MKCLICGSSRSILILSLGNQPLPNEFIATKKLAFAEEKYPLNLVSCLDCKHVQLKDIVPARKMFQNYIYIPSSSKTRITHFQLLAEELFECKYFKPQDLCVDIGSNDGSLLISFRNLGAYVLGVDPAVNLTTIAKLKGIECITDLISVSVAKQIVRKYKKATIITATNVVAHIQNLHDLISSIEILLEDKGLFVCEFPYLLDLIKKREFDTIYHEHLSYFSVTAFNKLLKDSHLEIKHIEKMNLDGGSVRIYMGWKKYKVKLINNFNQIRDEEDIFFANEVNEFKKFRLDIHIFKQKFKRLLTDLKRKNKTVIGWGAAAKGNILLNYCNINQGLMSYVVDSTPYKQGLYLPGSHIPVYSEEKSGVKKPDYIIILAWNFAKEIINKNRGFKENGGKFIIPSVTNLKIILIFSLNNFPIQEYQDLSRKKL